MTATARREDLRWVANVSQEASIDNFKSQLDNVMPALAAQCIRPHRLMNCLFPVPDCQPTATELFQSPLYGSGTVFRSISHLLRHFQSSALAWRHTSSNSVTRSYCCHAHKVTLSFMDTLIALTYLLTYSATVRIARGLPAWPSGCSGLEFTSWALQILGHAACWFMRAS